MLGAGFANREKGTRCPIMPILVIEDENKIAALIAAILIGFSRIYIGTHYLSDVVGGAVTAAASVAIVALLYRKESWVNAALIKIL